jgi:hypothetical protein
MTTTRLSPTILPGFAARMAATARALLVGEAEEGVFLVTLGGRVHGVLRRDPAGWRLAWLDNADPGLASFGDTVTADVAVVPAAMVPEALEGALAGRLGEAGAAALRVTPVLAF